jgi:hypothetical protein
MTVQVVTGCTPKALANESPGLLQPWVHVELEEETLKAFDRDEPFQGLQ